MPNDPTAEMRAALEMVKAAMAVGGDGQILGHGWNITKLNEARPHVLAALATPPASSPRT